MNKIYSKFLDDCSNIEKYYEIDAHFAEFDSKLDTYKNKKIEIKTETDAKNILNNLNKEFIVENISKVEKEKKSKEKRG